MKNISESYGRYASPELSYVLKYARDVAMLNAYAAEKKLDKKTTLQLQTLLYVKYQSTIISSCSENSVSKETYQNASQMISSLYRKISGNEKLVEQTISMPAIGTTAGKDYDYTPKRIQGARNIESML